MSKKKLDVNISDSISTVIAIEISRLARLAGELHRDRKLQEAEEAQTSAWMLIDLIVGDRNPIAHKPAKADDDHRT